MVFVNNKKYACATCIKGHRSSSCGHTDRSLFEIKKKGRPVTQCTHCRALRKTKQVHVKCMCEAGGDEAPDIRLREGEVSMYPNGVKDILASVAVSAPYPSDAPLKQKFDAILNPCRCKEGGECNCCTPRIPANKRKSPSAGSSCCSAAAGVPIQEPLSSPEASIASCCGAGGSSSPSDCQCPENCARRGQYAASPEIVDSRASLSSTSPPVQSCCAGVKCTPVHASALIFPAHQAEAPKQTDASTGFGSPQPSLISSGLTSSSSVTEHTTPLPSVSSLNSTELLFQEGADLIRCTCGELCTCPGCQEHNPTSAARSFESCPTICSSCFNCVGGLLSLAGVRPPSPPISATIPIAADGQAQTITSFLENQSILYGLPPAPVNRLAGMRLDGMNTLTYPAAAMKNPAVARASGLASIRPMCCGGMCRCAAGSCHCVDACGGGGGCADGASGESSSSGQMEYAVSSERHTLNHGNDASHSQAPRAELWTMRPLSLGVQRAASFSGPPVTRDTQTYSYPTYPAAGPSSQFGPRSSLPTLSLSSLGVPTTFPSRYSVPLLSAYPPIPIYDPSAFAASSPATYSYPGPESFEPYPSTNSLAYPSPNSLAYPSSNSLGLATGPPMSPINPSSPQTAYADHIGQ